MHLVGRIQRKRRREKEKKRRREKEKKREREKEKERKKAIIVIEKMLEFLVFSGSNEETILVSAPTSQRSAISGHLLSTPQ